MPLRAANASPSAVTAERQSTTVPNTSCTSACISVICRSSLCTVRQHARLGGEAEDAAPVEAEALVLGLAADEANVDLLDDHRELEGGEHLMPADRRNVEAGAGGVALDRL